MLLCMFKYAQNIDGCVYVTIPIACAILTIGHTNDIFGDVAPNQEKTLQVCFSDDNTTLALPEQRTKDYILSTLCISEKGYWIGEEAACEHAFDEKLCQNLIDFFKSRGGSVCDLGCGMGEYTRRMRKAGIFADGFDGNPDTPVITDGLANVLDLSIPFVFEKPYEWALTLEVGEHLPEKYESTLIDNITKNSTRGVVLSWAVEGQGGYGHFNCRNNDYIKGLFLARGYKNDVETENLLRSNVDLPWFKETIMVFTK